MNERFCYNVHQPIYGMVIGFINKVVDHLITRPVYKVIYFTTNKEHSGAVYDCFSLIVFFYMQNNTGAPFPNVQVRRRFIFIVHFEMFRFIDFLKIYSMARL